MTREFPRDGSIELATEKIVNAIVENKLDEKEINFLSKNFRYYEPLNKYEERDYYGKPIYGFKPTKLSLDVFSREELEQGIKEGMEKDRDLLLDMQNSGQLVPVPNEIFTNDLSTLAKREAEYIYKSLLNNEPASSYSIFEGFEAQEIYSSLLGNSYNSDKFSKLREAGDNIDKVTEEYFSIVKNEEPVIKDKYLQEFYDHIETAVYNSYFDHDEIDLLHEENIESATEQLHSKGLLKDSETYIILGSNINWRGQSGYNLKEIKDFDNLLKCVTLNCDCTIDITAKENTPYLEAMVYSHDVPTGSHVYILPESQWDKLIGYDKETKTFNQGYKFLEDYIKDGYNGEFIKRIFHARRKEIEMDSEAEKNPIVAKMKEIYYESLGADCDNSVDKFSENRYYVENAWHNVINYLAENIVQDTKISKKDYTTCEDLLIKFNPTLISSDKIAQNFKDICQEEIEYNKKIAAKCNNNLR